MGNNNFTENFADGIALTQAQLETALRSLTLDIANTTQLASGSTSGQVLTSTGSATAASFQDLPAAPGLFAKNFGLVASATSGILKIMLKSAALTDPTSTNKVQISFSNNSPASSATYTTVDVTSALSLSIPASASLGFLTTASQKVSVYAINNAGTARLAVSFRTDWDTGDAVTTTALSTSADSSNVIYASAALTVVPHFLGQVTTALNSTGSWQTPTGVSVASSVAPPTFKTGTSASVRCVLISASSGNFTTTSTAATSVTNFSGTITTSGRPVTIEAVPDTNLSSVIQVDGAVEDNAGRFFLLRDGSIIQSTDLCSFAGLTSNNILKVPPRSLSFVDTPAAGTYVYSIKASSLTVGTTVRVHNCLMIAKEFS